MNNFYTDQERKYKPYGLDREDINILHNYLCEITPSIIEDIKRVVEVGKI